MKSSARPIPFRKGALIAAAIAATSMLSACEDDLSQSDIRAAEKVMHDWASAWERHDGAGICATLTEGMQTNYGTGADGCARGAAAQSRRAPIKGPTRVRVRKDETGDRITGDVFPSASPLGSGEVTLVKVGGRWLLDEDFSCIFPDSC